MKRILIVAAVAALALSACATDGASQDNATSDSLPIDTAASSTDETPIPVEPNEGIGDGAEPLDLPIVDPSLAAVVSEAVEDLTARLGDDVLIEIVLAHELTWPDGSLGCPEPDMAYTQALIDGYRIELRADSELFEYHGALGEDPVLCGEVIDATDPYDGSNPGPNTTVSPSSDGSSTTAQAKADLAERLGVADSEIEVVRHEIVTWPDSSLGCPSKGTAYMQVLTSGTLTVLSVGGADYRYHSASGATPFLCLVPTDPVPPGGGDT